MSRYIEFAAASNFSFLRGASHPEELMLQAARLGLVGPRAVRPQFGRRRGARASDQARAEACARLSSGRAARLRRRHARHSRLSARPRRPGAGSAACSRAATCAPRRASASSISTICIDHIDGLELIVMERSTWELPALPVLRNKPMSLVHSNDSSSTAATAPLASPPPLAGEGREGACIEDFDASLSPSPPLPRKRGREHDAEQDRR